MPKLRLTLDELQVTTFVIDDAPDGAGTVHAYQTEPASVGGPCTGASCTYPPQLCRTCRTCFEDEGEQQPKR